MNEESIEKGPIYTEEDFYREVGERYENPPKGFRHGSSSPTEFFLHSLWGKLPMKGAPLRGGGIIFIPDEAEMREKNPRYYALLKAIDAFCEGNGIDRKSMSAKAFTAANQDTMIDLYIALRNQGFTHDEITQ